jgi:hypothetical protein
VIDAGRYVFYEESSLLFLSRRAEGRGQRRRGFATCGRILIKTYNISVYIEKSQEIFLRFKIIEKYQQMKI